MTIKDEMMDNERFVSLIEKNAKQENQIIELKLREKELMDERAELQEASDFQNKKLKEAYEFIKKLNDMNVDDFVHYAKTEIRIFNEDNIDDKK